LGVMAAPVARRLHAADPASGAHFEPSSRSRPAYLLALPFRA
jgi:hypothetical protein